MLLNRCNLFSSTFGVCSNECIIRLRKLIAKFDQPPIDNSEVVSRTKHRFLSDGRGLHVVSGSAFSDDAAPNLLAVTGTVSIKKHHIGRQISTAISEQREKGIHVKTRTTAIPLNGLIRQLSRDVGASAFVHCVNAHLN